MDTCQVQYWISFVRVAGGVAELEVEKVGEINLRSCVFFGEMFFQLQFITGQLREWTTRSKSRQSVAGGLDIPLLIEEKLIFSAK